MVRQICGLKVTESELIATLASTQRKTDTLRMQCAQLKATLFHQKVMRSDLGDALKFEDILGAMQRRGSLSFPDIELG